MAAPVGGNVHKYFDSEKFSDITLRVNGKKDIKAHKIILAQGSDYFKACFDGGFMEAVGGVAWLYEDEAEAVSQLVKHIYGHCLNHSGDEAKIASLAADARGPHSTVAIYVVGPKYLVPEACTQAKATFTAILEHLPTTSRHLQTFREVVQCIYDTYADEATDLRELVVAHFIEHTKDVAEKEGLRELFTQVPDFAFEVTTALLRAGEGQPTQANDPRMNGRKRPRVVPRAYRQPRIQTQV